MPLGLADDGCIVHFKVIMVRSSKAVSLPVAHGPTTREIHVHSELKDIP